MCWSADLQERHDPPDEKLHVKGVDIVDGTPVLDIKAYVPQFDTIESEGIGWLKDRIHLVKETKDDGRLRKLKADSG